MPTSINREQVRQLVAQGASLVEVLPAAEYEQQHIQGAISIPLKELSREAASRLQPDQPVVVYCNNCT